MTLSRKPLSDQIIVLSGAASAAGRSIAVKAARQGASLVLGSVDQGAAQTLADELLKEGGKAIVAVAAGDSESDMERLADDAIRQFGRIDTWISNLDAALCSTSSGRPVAGPDSVDAQCRRMLAGVRVARTRLSASNGTLVVVAVPDPGASDCPGDLALILDHVGIHCCELRAQPEPANGHAAITLIRPAPAGDGPPLRANRQGADPQEPILPVCPLEAIAAATLRAAQYPTAEIYVGGVFTGGPPPIHYTPCRQNIDMLHRPASGPGRIRGTQHTR